MKNKILIILCFTSFLGFAINLYLIDKCFFDCSAEVKVKGIPRKPKGNSFQMNHSTSFSKHI